MVSSLFENQDAVPLQTTSAALEVNQDSVSMLWERLGQSRHDPLSIDELQRHYSPALPLPLRTALAERLGMQEGRALHALLALHSRHGHQPELLLALGMTHQHEAWQRLHPLLSLDEDEIDHAVLLRSLACWGRRIDRSVIATALARPASDIRLAALELLTFHARLLSAEQLLELCAEPLDDLRPEVAIATLRLLQRRDEDVVVRRIAACICDRGVPPVCRVAIQALGCIGTEASAEALVECRLKLRDATLRQDLEHQIHAQFRHQQLMRNRLRQATAASLLSEAESLRLQNLLHRWS